VWHTSCHPIIIIGDIGDENCDDGMGGKENNMNDTKNFVDEKKILEILKRGNTAEVKETKNGITILEVCRKIRYKEDDEEEAVQPKK
jgi:hypothetical protein